MEHRSVSIWLSQLKKGDQEAAKNLWNRYAPILIHLARRNYRSVTSPEFDEEDLVQSVFSTLWIAATSGKLRGVYKRDELWWMLLRITRNKAINRWAYQTRQKRGDGKVEKRELLAVSDDSSIVQMPIADPNQPPADMILILDEEQQRLLAMLSDDTLRAIAQWKLDGYTYEEIATKLAVTPRTIVRKVNLIRECWAKELGP